MTQSSKFSAVAGLEAKLGQTWSQHGPEKKNLHGYSIKLLRFSVGNFNALAGLEVKLGQTWSQHGLDIVRNNRDSIAMGFRPC